MDKNWGIKIIPIITFDKGLFRKIRTCKDLANFELVHRIRSVTFQTQIAQYDKGKLFLTNRKIRKIIRNNFLEDLKKSKENSLNLGKMMFKLDHKNKIITTDMFYPFGQISTLEYTLGQNFEGQRISSNLELLCEKDLFQAFKNFSITSTFNPTIERRKQLLLRGRKIGKLILLNKEIKLLIKYVKKSTFVYKLKNLAHKLRKRKEIIMSNNKSNPKKRVRFT